MQRVGLTTQRRKPKPRNRSKHSKPEPIDDSWALPCDVLLPTIGAVTTIQAGCELSTLIAALRQRE
jgi:hypothetical protein